MANKIQNTINHALGDGARAAKFRCFVNIPFKSNNVTLDTLCKSSSFPGRFTDTIDFKHKGKSILIPGQEKYSQQWTLTFYLEEGHDTRIIFDKWMRSLQADTYDSGSNTTYNKNSYHTIMSISQLNYNMNKEIVQYFLYNAFPIEISQVEVSSESINTMLEYTVTFAFTHYTIDKVDGILSANDIADKIKSKVQEYANKAIDAGISAIRNTDFAKSIESAAGTGLGYLNGSISKITSSIDDFLG